MKKLVLLLAATLILLLSAAALMADGPTTAPVAGNTNAPASGGAAAPATVNTNAPASGGAAAPATVNTNAPASGGAAAPATGGNSTPSATQNLNVAAALNLNQDSQVVITGKLVQRLAADKYELKDDTGSITVIIENNLWNGQSVTGNDLVEISGKINKVSSPISIQADKITKK